MSSGWGEGVLGRGHELAEGEFENESERESWRRRRRSEEEEEEEEERNDDDTLMIDCFLSFSLSTPPSFGTWVSRLILSLALLSTLADEIQRIV